ncbi:MAG: thioesterase family protein [Actinomycetota bacterium]
MLGVVFNAHYLTYFDDTSTRFFESLGFPPKETFAEGGAFEAMLVKAVLEWRSPAGFDDLMEIAVRVERIGNASFDLRYVATVDGRVTCEATVTYVTVTRDAKESRPIPEILRARLESELARV